MVRSIATVVYDVANGWPVYILCTMIALFLAYSFLIYIRCFGGLILLLCFAAIIFGFLGAGFYTYYFARFNYDPQLPAFEALTYCSYALWAASALALVGTCFCWNSIKLGIAVFRTTAQYVYSNLYIVTIPTIAIMVNMMFLTIWLVGAIFVFSIGTPEPRPEMPSLTELKWENSTRALLYFYLFGLFWIQAFVIGCTQFVIGASACIWYFEVSTDSKGRFTVLKGVYWLCIFHWGSVALGSSLIAICQFLKVLFEQFRRNLGMLNQTLTWVKILNCLFASCLYCLEKFIKFMSKNAYIQIALTSKNFCPSAWNAFTLMIKHAPRFGMGASIGFIFLALGGIVITSGTCACAYFFLTSQPDLLDLTGPIAPTVIVGVIAVMISYQILSIFSFASDAILQSFLLDEEMRFLGNARPALM